MYIRIQKLNVMKLCIPNPCLENYEHMTPSDLGKFCSKCNIEVVDFTNWDPKDIIQYIKSSKTKVCGKLSKTVTNTKYSWSTFAKVAASVLLLHSWNNLKADTRPLELTAINSIQNMQSAKGSVTVQFVDSQNNPLPFIYLINTTTKQQITIDSLGQAKLSTLQDVKFKASLIGYETKNIKVNKADSGKTIKVTLNEQNTSIGEVVMKGSLPFSLRLKNWVNSPFIKDKE